LKKAAEGPDEGGGSLARPSKLRVASPLVPGGRRSNYRGGVLTGEGFFLGGSRKRLRSELEEWGLAQSGRMHKAPGKKMVRTSVGLSQRHEQERGKTQGF